MGNAAAAMQAYATAPPPATPTIKLHIAKDAGVVVLAEAGKDVLDFLLAFLAMSITAVVKLLGKDEDSQLAGLATLYASVQRQSPETPDPLPRPTPAGPARGFPSLVEPAAPPPATAPAPPSTSKALSSPPPLDGPVFNGGNACHRDASLAAQATYAVMDDLTVAPMPNIPSLVALLHRLGAKDFGELEERTVKIGYQEGLEIVKASLQLSLC